LRAESYLRIYRRSTLKTYPLSYILVSATRLDLTIGYTYLYSNGPTRPYSNIYYYYY
jgi:hypothetical protein